MESIKKNPATLVKTKTGRIGMVKSSMPLLNGRVPVYMATKFEDHTPVEFAVNGTLCNPETVEVIGFID